MEVVVNEYVINSILKNIGLTDNKSIKELDLVLKDEYRNIILIVTNSLDLDKLDNNCFLVTNKFNNKIIKSNKNIDLKQLIKKINSETEFNSYGVFKDLEKGYKDIKQLNKQIVNLTKIDTKKYIFSYIEDENINDLNTSINKLSRQVQNALILLISTNSEELVLINKKEEEHNYIIRRPKVNDFTEMKKLVFPYQDESRKNRKDIFSAYRTYSLEEFSSLCRKDNDSYALLYEENNEILGFIETTTKNAGRYNKRLSDSYVLSIEKIMVQEDKRRRKIATLLYKEILKYAKKIRVDRIEAKVYSFDIETTKFLESLNLQVQKTTYEQKLK